MSKNPSDKKSNTNKSRKQSPHITNPAHASNRTNIGDDARVVHSEEINRNDG